MAFHDHFSGHASDYARHRPHYPDELFEHLAEFAPGRRLAWDCGTGNGQAASRLARHFDRVVATDASAQQIDAAQPLAGLNLAVAAAEASPLEDQSVDLVTSAQAPHWFDLERFYGEVRRVARPGGAIALWSYGLMYVEPEFDEALMRLYRGIVGEYWPPERAIVEVGYQSLPFPFDEADVPEFEMVHEWTLAELLAYVRTWSAVQRYIAAEGHDPVPLVEAELAKCWGEEERRAVRWPLSMRLGRLP